MSQRPSFFERVFLGYRRQSLRNKAVFWIAVVAVALLVIPGAIRQQKYDNLHQARIYFSQPQQGITPGQLFPIEVRVQTTGTPINAVSAQVQYDPLSLQVVNMSTENSFCTFYLDNSFDNIKGRVTVSCGLPNPGFVGDSVVVHLNVRAKVAGSTVMKLSPQTQVLANDGHGTNITQDFSPLTLDIKQLL